MLKTKEICPDYVSKHNLSLEKKVGLLIVPNGEGWHFPVVTKLPRLLKGITSKHHSDFYCLNYHSFATENKCKSYKNYVK